MREGVAIAASPVRRDPPRVDLLWAGLGMLGITLAAGLSMGALLPLLAQVMTDAGESEAVIGWVAASSSLGVAVAAPFLTLIHRRLGARGAVLIGFVVLSAAVALMGLWREPLGFAILRLIGIIGMTWAWVTSEAWMVSLAPAKLRGRIMAAYATTFYAGISLGPLLLLVLGSDGAMPFLILGAILLSGILPLALVPRSIPRPGDESDGDHKPGPRLMLLALMTAPVVMVASLLAGFVEQVVFSLGTRHWQNVGWSPEDASILLSAFGVGGTVLMLGLGLAADRIGDARSVLLACIGLFAPVLVGLYLAADSFTGAFALSVLLGGLGNSIYTLALVLIGVRFTGIHIVAANSTFVVMYTIGNLLGPAVAGPVMAAQAQTGYLLSLGGAAVAFMAMVAIVSLVRQRRGARARGAGGTDPIE